MAEDNKADVSDAHEEYLNAASRVRAMQKQLARAATEEIGVKKVRTLPVAQVHEEEVEEDLFGAEVVKVRSLRESTRLASKRILPLGDSDDES